MDLPSIIIKFMKKYMTKLNSINFLKDLKINNNKKNLSKLV